MGIEKQTYFPDGDHRENDEEKRIHIRQKMHFSSQIQVNFGGSRVIWLSDKIGKQGQKGQIEGWAKVQYVCMYVLYCIIVS